MKQLTTWLARLEGASPQTLRESIFRVIVPGFDPIGVSDTIIKLEPHAPAPPRPGATNPDFVCFLRLFDTSPAGLTPALVAEDIGALLALVSDRRIEVAMEIMLSVEGRPATERHMLPLGSTVDRRARGPFDAGLRDQFISTISKISSLPADDVTVLGAATNLHYGALLLQEVDLRSAYVLVVAGIEVLSRAYGSPPAAWSDWEQSDSWDRLLSAQALEPAQAEAIRARLMEDKQLRLAATFKGYVLTSLPNAFWDSPWIEWHREVKILNGASSWGENKPVERKTRSILGNVETFGRALARSYDLRSKAVHAGDSVRLFEVALKGEGPIKTDEPVPYPVLRQVLRALIMHEVQARGISRPLPDIRFV